ncbi:DUF7097 family protein [Haloarcula halophila]|uniref:DUF7097 family protein n=1 Tax=Haloarcula TaxID=2237 RepID=UPI0023E4438D|nr:hypothetical protein [Halomicroarcula sp. DFY41]
MEKAPGGTSVGVDDPYDHVDRCDFVTDEGKCRWAREHGHHDPEFADARSAEEFRCPAAVAPDGDTSETRGVSEQSGRERPAPRDETEWEWADCPHFRCRQHDRECVRCGLTERRMAHSDERPLLEEHHLSYRDSSGDTLDHEITVYLCRWCHAKVHQSWARIDDDAGPDPEALAEREGRRSKEQSELGFESAAERYRDDEDAGDYQN